MGQGHGRSHGECLLLSRVGGATAPTRKPTVFTCLLSLGAGYLVVSCGGHGSDGSVWPAALLIQERHAVLAVW